MATVESIATKKIINFTDLNGTPWTLTILGPLEASFSIGADVVDDEIKSVDVINIHAISEVCFRFRIYEDAVRKIGFAVRYIPVPNGKNTFSGVTLVHDSMTQDIEVTDYDRDNNTYCIR